ncbi:MAG: hypothetical protein SNG35_04920 [Rikenellaceae bacterium]
MKLNRIISKFFALAAAVMVVAACSDDPTEDGITGSGKPTPPVGDGETYFNFEVVSEKQIDDYEYVAAIGETIKFSDLSEATISHEWQLSSVEGMEFMLADGTTVDSASVDISFDDEVIVRFKQAGEYTITLVNRYSENVTYTYPPEPSGSPASVNGTEIGESGYYQMEWDVDVVVYSEEYNNLSASFFTSNDFATAVDTPWSPKDRSLFIKDTTPYSNDYERPSVYTWISTTHSFSYNDDESGVITFKNQDDDNGTVEVLFNEETVDGDEIHIRMIVERYDGGEESGWLPAIAATPYNGLSYVDVDELDMTDLVISGITPYDADNSGSTNQIELTLDSSNSGSFDAAVLAASSDYSKFTLAYTDNTNGGSGSVTGTGWSVGSSSKSLVIAFNGSIYTNDSDIALTLSSDIADIDQYSVRPLTATAVNSAGANIAYERYNFLPDSEFNFNNGNGNAANWAVYNSSNSLTGGYVLSTASIVASPLAGDTDNVLMVDFQVLSSESGHQSVKNSNYPINVPAGDYIFTCKVCMGAGGNPANTTTNLTMTLAELSSINSQTINGGSTGGTSLGSTSNLPYAVLGKTSTSGGISTGNFTDGSTEWYDMAVNGKSSTDAFNIASDLTGTDLYVSFPHECIRVGSVLYFKDFKLQMVNDRPAN